MIVKVNSYLTPTAESASAVNAWLSTNDLTASVISSAGDWLAVDVPLSKANELLGADYSVFTHVETGKQTIRTLSYSIPANLTGHLDLVHPTISCVAVVYQCRCALKTVTLQVPGSLR